MDNSEDAVSSHSASSDNKTSNSDNSYFDPPIENYRFYYQSGNQGGSTLGTKTQQTGFYMKQRKEVESMGDRLLDDDGTETFREGF